MSLYDGKFTIILLVNITLDSKPRRGIDISLMSYGFSYLLHFIDEVHKVLKRCHNIVGKALRFFKRSALPLRGVTYSAVMEGFKKEGKNAIIGMD